MRTWQQGTKSWNESVNTSFSLLKVTREHKASKQVGRGRLSHTHAHINAYSSHEKRGWLYSTQKGKDIITQQWMNVLYHSLKSFPIICFIRWKIFVHKKKRGYVKTFLIRGWALSVCIDSYKERQDGHSCSAEKRVENEPLLLLRLLCLVKASPSVRARFPPSTTLFWLPSHVMVNGGLCDGEEGKKARCSYTIKTRLSLLAYSVLRDQHAYLKPTDLSGVVGLALSGKTLFSAFCILPGKMVWAVVVVWARQHKISFLSWIHYTDTGKW